MHQSRSNHMAFLFLPIKSKTAWDTLQTNKQNTGTIQSLAETPRNLLYITLRQRNHLSIWHRHEGGPEEPYLGVLSGAVVEGLAGAGAAVRKGREGKEKGVRKARSQTHLQRSRGDKMRCAYPLPPPPTHPPPTQPEMGSLSHRYEGIKKH